MAGNQSVLVTPFDDKGAIDIARFETLAQMNTENGADGPDRLRQHR